MLKKFREIHNILRLFNFNFEQFSIQVVDEINSVYLVKLSMYS